MSWIIGYSDPSRDEATREKIGRICGIPLYHYRNENLAVWVGGIPSTIRVLNEEPQGSDHYHGVVCGLGIMREGGRCAFLDVHRWQDILADPLPKLRDIDGHFVACRWKGDTIDFFADQFGFRTLYLARVGTGYVFSTKLDWVARIARTTEVDFEAFGPSWIALNAFANHSILKNTTRLGPGGEARIERGELQISSTPWIPTMKKRGPEEFENILLSLSNPISSDAISIGLSGGLDSRLLLSIVLHQGGRVKAHTFESPMDPDVKMAKQIAEKLNLRHLVFEQHLDSPERLWEQFTVYAADSLMGEPITSALPLGHFRSLPDWCGIMVDGGFGEISRRQYLNRLLLQGKKALRSRHPHAILPFLAHERARIFNAETELLMSAGCEKSLTEMLEHMPDVRMLGEENFLDLIAVRTRFPFWGGAEQVRLDGIVCNYMPLAQPSLVDCMFGLPLRHRHKGRLYRSLIEKYCPILTGLPLVKSGGTYPYSLGPIGAYLWVRAKNRLFPPPPHDLAVKALHVTKEYVLDLVGSESVRSYAHYDVQAIHELANRFYSGDQAAMRPLAWWLSFELWRQHTHI